MKIRYKWQREQAMRRIREIPDAKLLEDLDNPDKDYKHWRIVQEFGRRYLAIGVHLPLKSGKVVTVYDFRGDGYFQTGINDIPLFVDVVDWEKVVKRQPSYKAVIVKVIQKKKEEPKPKPKSPPQPRVKQYQRRFSKWTAKDIVNLLLTKEK